MNEQPMRKRKKTLRNVKEDEESSRTELPPESLKCKSTCEVNYGLDTLPNEIIAQILIFLPGTDINIYRQLSSRYKELINTHRLLEHNELTITSVCSYYQHTDKMQINFNTKTHFFFVGLDSVCTHKTISFGRSMDEQCSPGDHPIIRRFYNPDVARPGKEFLRNLFPIAKIKTVRMDFKFHSYRFSKRFFDIVAECPCPIKRILALNLSEAEEVLKLLQTVNFNSRQNVHLNLFVGSNFGDWDLFEKLASVSNLRFLNLTFLEFLSMIQHIVENWLMGRLKQSFALSCTEKVKHERFPRKKYITSGEDFARKCFGRSDIDFEGVTQQDFEEMKCIHDLPNFFQIVRTVNRSFISFTKEKGGVRNYTVVFHDS